MKVLMFYQMIDFLRRHDEWTQHIQGDGFNPYCVGCNLRSGFDISIAKMQSLVSILIVLDVILEDEMGR